jgi:hypothetical protein
MRTSTVGITFFLIVTFLSMRANGQIYHQIPESQRPSLEARLKLFTQAQDEGRWDIVASMLGRYRKNSGRYTHTHKECLISQMQSLPMISFRTNDRQFTKANIPLSQGWWSLEGEVVLRTKSGDQARPIAMDAYLDKGQWYFSPLDYDTYWLRNHLTDADLSADYSDEIEIASAPSSSLEIVDVHASLNKETLKDLDVTFKLRNRSSKTVKAFGWRHDYEQYGTGCCEIEPGSSLDQKISSHRYDHFVCGGVKKDKLLVDSVLFVDGSRWEPTTNTHASEKKMKPPSSPNTATEAR